VDPETAVVHFWSPGGVRSRHCQAAACRVRHRCCYGRCRRPVLLLLPPPVLLRLLLVLLYSQFGD